MSKHVWLVLAGSGMKMFAFLGAIKALVEAGYTFSGVTGTSGGAITAAGLGKHWDASDPSGSVDRLIAEGRALNPAKIFLKSTRWRVWEWILTTLLGRGARGVFRTDKLLETFRAQAPATIGDCAIPVQIVAYQVNLHSPKTVIFSEPDVDLPLAMLGSMSLPPPIFDSTFYGKAELQDGGWVKNFAVPVDQGDVVGLYFGSEKNHFHDTPGIIEDPKRISPIRNNLEMWSRIVFGLMDVNVRESIEDAEDEGINLMKLELRTDLEGFDFFADQAKIDKAITDGYESAKLELARNRGSK